MIVVFDEVWRFFKGVRDYIEEMYRTFRKYSAGIVSITQNAANYGDDEFARMIFSNSFTEIFLEGGASRSLLSAWLDLSSSDIDRALSVASRKPIYSEFFASSTLRRSTPDCVGGSCLALSGTGWTATEIRSL
jgi:hypothetical protein